MASLIAAILVLVGPLTASAQELPVITIIIDDMGNHESHGRAALAVPGAVTYAFLPHTPFAREFALKAHGDGKEVMLHLPMQSHEGNRLGPGALTLHMTEKAFKQTLERDLDAIPHVKGINNHMGSLLTRHPGAMEWLMQGVKLRGNLFFIDSRTTHETVGEQIAKEYGIPNSRRDIFLDNDRNPDAIRDQFRRLIDRAQHNGHAIGIGHPYPETSQILQEVLADIESLGIRLIPASEMIAQQGRNKQWHVPSSPSLKVAKSSKQ